MTDTRIIIIGAGMAGIAMTVQLQRRLGCYDYEVYDKWQTPGGTWAQNTYPNLSCDFYSYSFFQNPDWTEKFATQPEILAYIEHCIDHFAIRPRLRMQQECLSATWSDQTQSWHLRFRDLSSGHVHDRKAKYLITATGVLNVPRGLDDLPVLQNFKGSVLHTSQWRDIDWDGKHVLVVGNGCSANQVIPWILAHENPAHVTQVFRSPQWTAPKPKHTRSLWIRRLFRHLPVIMWVHRLWTAWQLDRAFFMFRKTAMGDKAREQIANDLRKYITSTASPDFHDILIPAYDFGAKRPVMDHGYLASTFRDNFDLVKCDGLVRVEDDSRTIIDAAGHSHYTDIVVLANGFATQDLLTPMIVRGRNGASLQEEWHSKGGSEAYMGVSVHGFSNLFLLTGPNTLPTGNSTLHGIECSVIYITRLLKGAWAAPAVDGVMIEPDASEQARYNEKVQQDMRQLVYSSAVSTWYINKETGKNTLIWPGTQFSFWWSRCISAIEWQAWGIAT